MNKKTYGVLFEQAYEIAFEKAIWENYKNIQLPSSAAIEASFRIVLKKFEKRSCSVNAST
jgi:hypothetical protein